MQGIAAGNLDFLSQLPTNTLDINTIVLFSEENSSSNPPWGHQFERLILCESIPGFNPGIPV